MKTDTMITRSVPRVLAWLAALGAPAGADVYIDPNAGSDTTGNGTLAAPYRSLTHALTFGSAFQDFVMLSSNGGLAIASEATGETFPIVLDGPQVSVRGGTPGTVRFEPAGQPSSILRIPSNDGDGTLDTTVVSIQGLEFLGPTAVSVSNVPNPTGPDDEIFVDLTDCRVELNSSQDGIYAQATNAYVSIYLSRCHIKSTSTFDPNLVEFVSFSSAADQGFFGADQTIFEGGKNQIRLSALGDGGFFFDVETCVFKDGERALNVGGDWTNDPYTGWLRSCTLRNLDDGVFLPAPTTDQVAIWDCIFASVQTELDPPTAMYSFGASQVNYTDGSPGIITFQTVPGLSSQLTGVDSLLPSSPLIGALTGSSPTDLHGRKKPSGPFEPGAIMQFSRDQIVSREGILGLAPDSAVNGAPNQDWLMLYGVQSLTVPAFQLGIVPLGFLLQAPLDSTGYGQASIPAFPNDPTLYGVTIFWQASFFDPGTGLATYSHSPVSTRLGSI